MVSNSEGALMTEAIETNNIEEPVFRRMWSVADFARRYRLGKEEEIELIARFGPFASEPELLKTARRPAPFF
jgi:hypothetical protein